MSNTELQRSGEDAAARHLEQMGMKIIVRNWRLKMGEIDLIAMDGPTLVFVEVKARGRADFVDPSLAVTHSKQAKLRRLAEAYVAFERPVFEECRFDVISVVDDGRGPAVRHIPDAFRGW